MSTPANIRINVRAPFPALVQGAGPIGVTKKNGVWTISANYVQLVQLAAVDDLASSLLAIYDPMTGQFNQVTAGQISALSVNAYRVYPAVGPVVPTAADVVILLGSATPPPANITLPLSQSRAGLPLTVKDYAGQASVANPYTFVPNGTETIDGFGAAAAAANGVALIDIAYGKKTLYPLTNGGWYL